MLETIDLKSALEIMDKTTKDGEPLPFNISFRTLNRYSNKGGKLNFYEGAKKAIMFVSSKSTTNTLRHEEILKDTPIKRNPKHWKNRTRNIVLSNGDIRKIHLRLIISINGKQVVY